MSARIISSFFICALVLGVSLFPCRAMAQDGNSLYQVSAIQALYHGLYDGEATVGELKRHGDIGLGVFNCLDGVLVALDGAYFRIGPDGLAAPAGDESKLPFAAVARFAPDRIHKLDKVRNMEELNDLVARALPSDNVFAAVRIDGDFNNLKTASFKPQEKPYKPLEQVIKDQAVFKTGKARGTLVGIKSPSFFTCGVPGVFSWVFLSEDRRAGGMVLDCAFEPLVAKMDIIHRLEMVLPESDEYHGLDLSKPARSPENAAEAGRTDKAPETAGKP